MFCRTAGGWMQMHTRRSRHGSQLDLVAETAVLQKLALQHPPPGSENSASSQRLPAGRVIVVGAVAGRKTNVNGSQVRPLCSCQSVSLGIVHSCLPHRHALLWSASGSSNRCCRRRGPATGMVLGVAAAAALLPLPAASDAPSNGVPARPRTHHRSHMSRRSWRRRNWRGGNWRRGRRSSCRRHQ